MTTPRKPKTGHRNTTPPARKVAVSHRLRKTAKPAVTVATLAKVIEQLQKDLAEARTRLAALEADQPRRLGLQFWRESENDRKLPPLSPQPGWPTPGDWPSPTHPDIGTPSLDPDRFTRPFSPLEITCRAGGLQKDQATLDAKGSGGE